MATSTARAVHGAERDGHGPCRRHPTQRSTNRGRRPPTTRRPFLQLPVDVTGVVSDLPTEVTTGAATDDDRMLAPQDWFQTFKYSTEAQAGHSNNAIENFLHIRNGSSDQFAATFAAIARTLDDPSRLAVGFTPGLLTRTARTACSASTRTCGRKVRFNGIGLVQFEPTPLDPRRRGPDRRRSGPATAPKHHTSWPADG